MKVLLCQIDGKLPNLALMKLSHYFKSLNYEVTFTDRVHFKSDIKFDLVFASSIFDQISEKARIEFKKNYPLAFIGGTGTKNKATIEVLINEPEYEFYDYSIYPNFEHSIGFTQRGCRLSCKFCVVPEKEGKNKSVNTIEKIWRPNTPKKIHLLDNDFFGAPNWKSVADEIINGKFKVCFNQGINTRLITDESAEYLAKIKYYNDSFTRRVLYTAWDNLKDEKVFFNGVNTLHKHGIPYYHLMVYMLVGYSKTETWESLFYRFERMKVLRMMPYPMVFDPYNKHLKKFQRWVIRRYYQFIPWNEFNPEAPPLNELTSTT